MKNFTLGAIVTALLLLGGVAYAAGTILYPIGGGTGQSTLTSSQLLYGAGGNPIQTVATGTLSVSSPLTIDNATRSLVGGAATISCSSCATFAFPFTPQSWGNSTTSIIGVGGIISTASSTFSYLGTGAMYSQNGSILSHATTSASVASQDLWRDINQNAFAQNFVSAATTFPSNGLSVTLTAASPRTWIITGTKTQTVKLPIGTTLSNGATYVFNDNSTGTTTVTDNGNNVIGVVLPGGNAQAVLYDNSTSNGTWDLHTWLGHQVYSGTNNISIASTSPWATLSIHANPTDSTVYTTLFAVGSSTASATTTLFKISNTGSTTLSSLFGACNTTSALTTDASGNIACGAITGTTYSATWPVTLSGTTFGFNGLSTSTAAVVGNIPYFSGVNTFANVATTSVTCNNGISCLFNAIGTVGTVPGLATIAANSVLANQTSASAVPSALATSSLFTFSPAYTTTAGVLQNVDYKTFTVYATTTSGWTGTSTTPLGFTDGSTWKTMRCVPYGTNGATNTGGFIGVDFYWGSSHLDFLIASSTIGTTTFATNNALPLNQQFFVAMGTTTTNTVQSVSCTVKRIL